MLIRARPPPRRGADDTTPPPSRRGAWSTPPRYRSSSVRSCLIPPHPRTSGRCRPPRSRPRSPASSGRCRRPRPALPVSPTWGSKPKPPKFLSLTYGFGCNGADNVVLLMPGAALPRPLCGEAARRHGSQSSSVGKHLFGDRLAARSSLVVAIHRESCGTPCRSGVPYVNSRARVFRTCSSVRTLCKISLKGHYTFHNDEKLIDLDAIVAGLDLG